MRAFPLRRPWREGPRQGERRSDSRGPDTAPGYRVEWAGSRAPSGATEQDCTVHGTAASHHHRSPKAELLRARARRCARNRWRDMAGLWTISRRETERPARSSASGQLSGAPGQTDIHPEGGRLEAATQHSLPGRQNRPTGGRVRSGGHLRGGFSRLLVWVPTGARAARCAGRSPRRDSPEASELGARFGYPGLFRCHGPFVDDPISRAPYRGQAHPAPDCEMAEGRHHGRRARTRSERGTPQGAVISPILANVYLHYVFDLWTHRWRRKASGDVIVIRYADDTIVGFQHEHEAKAFLHDLQERMREFELALHPAKTRLIRSVAMRPSNVRNWERG